jgi:hypothetical protein
LHSDKEYFEVGQTTGRSCMHCQFFFLDATPMQRESLIDELLSIRYRPELGDRTKPWNCTKKELMMKKQRKQGVDRSSKHQKY